MMDKATEIMLNQGITGAIAVIFLIALVFIGKLLLKEKDLRIKELQERNAEKKDENHQTFMDYLSTVHTMVNNSEKMMEKFIDAFASFKAFIEMIVEHRKRGL